MANLDIIDLKILQLLQANALMTNKEIAARLNLTTTPIQAWEKSGCFSGCYAERTRSQFFGTI